MNDRAADAADEVTPEFAQDLLEVAGVSLRDRFNDFLGAAAGSVDSVEIAFINALFSRAQRLSIAGARDRVLMRAASRIGRLEAAWVALGRRDRSVAPVAPKVSERRNAALAAWYARRWALRAGLVGVKISTQRFDAAGPYNGVAVAARALQMMLSLSPCYMRSFLEHMEDMACELPAPRKALVKRSAKSQKRRIKRDKER